MAEETDDHTLVASDLRSRARCAAALDLALSVVATMLIWPFPVMRRVVSAPVHVVLVFAGIMIVGALMHFWVVRWKGFSPGMYFFGLRLESLPSSGVLVLWAVMRSLLLLPATLVPAVADPEAGPIAQLTGVRVVAE